jgi:deoxyribonuclease V
MRINSIFHRPPFIRNEIEWPDDVASARAIQEALRSQVVREDRLGPVNTVAGVDVGFEDGGKTTRAAVAMLAFPGLEPVAQAISRSPTRFPYVPGYLSFRELPAVLEALDRLARMPDLILCDGQGLAHPRRFGLACHLGVLTDIPCIGVAKSRLVGSHDELPPDKGQWVPLRDKDETIGAVSWAQNRHPRDRVVLIGSSLGGNFALRIAARAEAAGLEIDRVVAICPVLDPEESMHALDYGAPIYQRYFMRRWRKSLELKKAAFPARYDFSRLERFRTLTEMTDYFVRHYTEFADIQTYLRGYALTGVRLADLRVPSTMLLAADDPVIPIGGLARVARPDCLRIDTTSGGGHCGFISDYRLNSWSDEYVMNALEGSG